MPPHEKRPGSVPAPRAQNRRIALAAAGIFLFGILAYANTLGHGFVWDDPIWLEQKIRFYTGPLDAFFEPTWMPIRQVYRPLSQLTYWLDQTLWWRNAFGFHLTSVLLHAVNGLFVLWLARTIGLGLVSAATAALLFLVHPIQPETVAWITNRVDEVATLFVLAAALAALRPPSLATLAVVGIASFGAAASKETGCVVPALVAATALLAPSSNGEPRRAPWIAAVVSTLGVLPYFALRPSEAGTGIELGTLGADALTKLAGSVGYQVERLWFPIGFRPYLAHVPTDARTLALAVTGALVTGAALLLSDASGRRRFAVFWIVVATVLPVLVVLADFSATPVAEHRLYLAVVGLALVVAITLEGRVGSSQPWTVAMAIALTALTAVTVVRNRFWHDDLTLWTAVTARVDDEPTPYLNLGLALAEAKRPTEAEVAYRRGLGLEPKDVARQRLSINLGLVLLERGALDEAESLFTTADAIGGHAIAYRGLALIARKRSQEAARAGDAATANAELTKAHGFLQQALAINPRYAHAHHTLGGVLYDAGRYRAALAAYQRATEVGAGTDVARESTEAAAQLSTWLAAHPEAP